MDNCGFSKYHLTPSMKMSELMNVDFSLLGVLNRMGIPFGFGDDSVEDVCRRQEIDPQTFLLICRLYAFRSVIPGKELLMSADIRDILKYLRRSHTYYMDVAMKDLEMSLEKMTAPCGKEKSEVLRKFFLEYKEELRRHFENEEDEVFPYVESVVERCEGRGCSGGKGFSISKYGNSHDDVDEKLDELERIVMREVPSDCDQQDIYRALQNIFSLKEDIRMHTAVENDLLVPLVGMLEKKNIDDGEQELLSPREKEILVGVAKGLLNKEIADLFNISINTVITHRKNITRKTGIKTIAGLTMYALLNDLVVMK
ncbi:MAG: LuxR C-terminal-related transcriptional regulator [Candidatus Cryptobacteroides sp.]